MALLPDRDASEWSALLDDLDDPRVERVFAEIAAYLTALKKREAGFLDNPLSTSLPETNKRVWWALGFAAGTNGGIMALSTVRTIVRAALKREGERRARERTEHERAGRRATKA